MTDPLILSRRVALVGAGAALLSLADAGAMFPSNEAHGETPVRDRIATTDHPRTTNMNILRTGSQPSTKGSAEYFTGAVRIDMPFKGSAPARLGGALVTFEPGARTAWHTHPLGQTLIVTSGMGWVQTEGGPKEEIRAGDIVWIPPSEKHWHGATATTGMTHIAIAEALDGKAVDWMDKVRDEQYLD